MLLVFCSAFCCLQVRRLVLLVEPRVACFASFWTFVHFIVSIHATLKRISTVGIGWTCLQVRECNVRDICTAI